MIFRSDKQADLVNEPEAPAEHHWRLPLRILSGRTSPKEIDRRQLRAGSGSPNRYPFEPRF